MDCFFFLQIALGMAAGVFSTGLAAGGYFVGKACYESKRREYFQKEFGAREFVSFRGQHFKFLRRYQIVSTILEITAKESWHCESNLLTPGKKDARILEQIIRIPKSRGQTRLWLRYSLETYGTFSQILYEWSGDAEAVRDASSPECRAIQNLVNQVEKALGEAELRKSRHEFKSGGSRTYEGVPFSPEIVRHILADAIAAVDDQGKPINFKVSLEGRKNQWVKLVEAYVTVENVREFHLRFYSLDQSVNGLSAWELCCDWKGSLTAMLDYDSPEWEIVHALYQLVQGELNRAGARTCFPSGAYAHGLNIGLYRSWDSKVLERISRGLADALKYQPGVPISPLSYLNTHGREARKKHVPGSCELEVFVAKRTQGMPVGGARAAEYDMEREHCRVDLCIQFLPYPPLCGEFILAWNDSGEEESEKQSSACDELIRYIEKKLYSRMARAGALRVNFLKVRRILFLQDTAERAETLVRSSWPTPQDYNEAVQSLEVCFADSDLKSGCVEVNVLGIPRSASGAFASVYRVTSGKRDWALRCFNSPVKDQLLRYQKASKFICGDDLPYTIWCEYIEQGVHISAKWYPVVKMEWVEGKPFCSFVTGVLSDRDALTLLRRKFQQMLHDLRCNGVAHGDLQHGNMIIRDGEIILVDYDNFFVPELAGLVSWETGHRNYQHPHRNSSHFGPYLDHFSAWVIDSALLCLIHDPKLWSRFGAGEENMLFFASDFMNPDDSELLQLLLNHKNAELSERAHFLISLLSMDMRDLPPLNVEISHS
jgi:hypothetical protein